MPLSDARRHDDRILLHFDYDCFYAAVFEKENPQLKSLPFAVQQKQIIVTCNYEARRRGLHKLQLVQEAKKRCPDVVIVLGEDLTRFRSASRDNYEFLRTFSWNDRLDRLGFDEVFMDVTDMIDYNIALVNKNDPSHSFFHLESQDPLRGFHYDASRVAGDMYPPPINDPSSNLRQLSPYDRDDLVLRLQLGSHLAQHLRRRLEEVKGYTATVGISTNKLLSKLIGNLNKPCGQTTLYPPYHSNLQGHSNIRSFLDGFDIGGIPGIGFKVAQKLREAVLSRYPSFSDGLVYSLTQENVTVLAVRELPNFGIHLLRDQLQGPGMPKDLPKIIWGLLDGRDDSQVAKARRVPQQISMEDSYLCLDDISMVTKELQTLSQSLLKQMRIDLTQPEADSEENGASGVERDKKSNSAQHARLHWIAFPRTLRLSTRPRAPVNAQGLRPRSFARVSKSRPLPSFVLNLHEEAEALAHRLVEEAALPLFRQLHPEQTGWNLSLVNLCVTNIENTSGNSKEAIGRDISKMFGLEKEKKAPSSFDTQGEGQNRTRNESTVLEVGEVNSVTMAPCMQAWKDQQKCNHTSVKDDVRGQGFWIDDMQTTRQEYCQTCEATIPLFAIKAHEQFHTMSG